MLRKKRCHVLEEIEGRSDRVGRSDRTSDCRIRAVLQQDRPDEGRRDAVGNAVFFA